MNVTLRVTRDYTIIIPKGDTGIFTMSTQGINYRSGDIAIFAVCEIDSENNPVTVLKKEAPIVDDVIVVLLENKDTRDLAPKRYLYDIRLVFDPERDDDGNVIVTDKAANVHSMFSLYGLPSFVIKEVGVTV